MKNSPLPSNEKSAVARRLFLRGIGKWSGAAIAAAVTGTWFASAPQAEAGRWVNRRGGGGGGWANARGGGGGWVNRRGAGGGGWANGRGGGGGGWINRF